jgi:hypothetical protein
MHRIVLALLVILLISEVPNTRPFTCEITTIPPISVACGLDEQGKLSAEIPDNILFVGVRYCYQDGKCGRWSSPIRVRPGVSVIIVK